MAGEFVHDAPDRVWVADVTQHRTVEGWLYLAVVLDLFQRKVVGWAMDDRLDIELVLTALQMAQQTRRPHLDLIHHTDQGSVGAFKWASPRQERRRRQHGMQRHTSRQRGRRELLPHHASRAARSARLANA